MKKIIKKIMSVAVVGAMLMSNVSMAYARELPTSAVPVTMQIKEINLAFSVVDESQIKYADVPVGYVTIDHGEYAGTKIYCEASALNSDVEIKYLDGLLINQTNYVEVKDYFKYTGLEGLTDTGEVRGVTYDDKAQEIVVKGLYASGIEYYDIAIPYSDVEQYGYRDGDKIYLPYRYLADLGVWGYLAMTYDQESGVITKYYQQHR